MVGGSLPSVLRVRVPATSANLGPGFDALGVAVDLYLEVMLQPSERDEFHYQGDGPAPQAEGNLVHLGFKSVYAALGLEAPPVALHVNNPIPLARGLGSSSAALVAGGALADGLLGEPLGRDGVFRLMAAHEGHPDNVGPAVYGHLTVAAQDERGDFHAASLPVPQSWRFLFASPSFELPTSEARAALPDSYPRSDLVLTSSRTALWLAAAALDKPELLATASLDVVHTPYRTPLVPGLSEVLVSLRAAGAWAAFLSGAGPTVGAVVDDDHLGACRDVLRAFVGDAGLVMTRAPAPGYVLHKRS